MPKINVYDQLGNITSEITLSDYVYGIEPHQQSLYDVINAQRAAMRQGTHSVKNRSEVRGGGRKPWRQKGTGRARQGSIRAPHWRKGGVVFGPTPSRNYKIKFNRKVRQLALRSALSYHALNNQLILVDTLAMETPKTKSFVEVMKNLNVEGKALFVANEFAKNEILAARNIPTVAFSNTEHVSVYDILNCKNLVMTKEAALALEEALKND